MICWGSQLNPTVKGLDDGPCGVYDLQVIPNDDPAKGSTLPLFESEFLQTLGLEKFKTRSCDNLLKESHWGYVLFASAISKVAVCVASATLMDILSASNRTVFRRAKKNA